MTITWINCAERMPPDDRTKIIAKYQNYPPIKTSGERINDGLNRCIPGYRDETVWAIFTEEAWSELTK